ncbi:hypothetical protein K492DRAFT_188994 [Lichtheimia hyalospora FSU 10163]|nr:hypothetical protein K492DRAFT_188994 [Lichtheimia hyalospora FSU 10163]
MNQHNPDIPNEQHQLNLGMQNNTADPNWRNELPEHDRNRYITQLARGFKLLSPNTSDNDTDTAARSFEQTIYNNSINMDQYIRAYSMKIDHIQNGLRDLLGNQ